jgi:hypothetical protein
MFVARLRQLLHCMVSDGGERQLQVGLTTLSSCTRIVFANYKDNLIQIFVRVFFTFRGGSRLIQRYGTHTH